jgi:hypothetical protein
MSDATPAAPCTICKGSKAEHFDNHGQPTRQHAYTTKDGDLVTNQEMAKRNQPQGQRTPFNPAMLMGGNPMTAARLTEVLLEKGVLTTDDALYIAMMGPKPTPKSGFMDPATVVEVKR